MKEAQVYTRQFFQSHRCETSYAAEAIVPTVLELYQPCSVVDVGCGIGIWLAAFQKYGVEDILGIDGPYIDRGMLAIPQERFTVIDLGQSFTLERTYDLAVCLEVAEHLAPEHAADFVAALTRLAPVVLFSAAIPLQGGRHHLNEQWPEYWVQQFQAHGFLPIDVIRGKIWNRDDLPIYYRQNILLFCNESILASQEALNTAMLATSREMLSIVHPQQYLYSIKRYSPTGHLRSLVGKIQIAKKAYHILRERHLAPGDA